VKLLLDNGAWDDQSLIFASFRRCEEIVQEMLTKKAGTTISPNTLYKALRGVVREYCDEAGDTVISLLLGAGAMPDAKMINVAQNTGNTLAATRLSKVLEDSKGQ
jgi:hypothetical protein